jgi:hypothetical protein
MTRAEGMSCLEQHKLVRAPPLSEWNCAPNDEREDCQPVDENHPSRWYLPPGLRTFKMRYQIPSNLACTSCTLQWQWYTGNSCVPGADVGCHFDRMRAEGWNVDDWCGVFCGTCTSSSLLQTNASSEGHCGEEFRNCADVRVISSGVSSATTTVQSQSTAISTTTTVQSQSTQPSSTAEPEPCDTVISATTTVQSQFTQPSSTAEPEPESEPESEPCDTAIMAQMPQRRARVAAHHFLGSALVQDGAFASKSDVAEVDEL